MANEDNTLDKTSEKIEGVLKKKEREIEKAEETINKLEDLEEKFELKEFDVSTDSIENICTLPSRQMITFAKELIKKFNDEIGINSHKSRENRLQKYFDAATWGKAPTKAQENKVKRNLSKDLGSSAYKVFNQAHLAMLVNTEKFDTQGVQVENTIRKAILDWELAVEKYEYLAEDAKNVFTTDIKQLIDGKEIFHRKPYKRYDDVSYFALFYKNAEAVSKGIQKYCATTQKALADLTTAFNGLFKELTNTWASISVDEANFIQKETNTSQKKWADIQNMAKSLEK